VLKFVFKMLTTSSKCLTPRIGITRSTFLLKFGNKALSLAKERQPEPKERTLTVSKLSQWLGFSEGGFKLFETIERATNSNN